ncbi:TetR/AcrR family transcriptional regulator [Sediminibacillus halophilus]|uniref:DNA-binding transcriptional regulator, AcrR family n=1 Tax=Sediminibacillus halophilus TaxID=482461 RepID=A0A1G9UDG6_9BACI|nr:TetR/AcrR family transcriptional regulator [Sediminibacillus halophilus]SDM57969.1 DNA-binding transcriptional regulator, AcrR family [Sediminibacillus halophilus]
MKEAIRDAAVRHFNAYGYEGVKMNRIAEELGIRKQSLSYHYASKSKLLTDTYANAMKEEVIFLEEFFCQAKSLEPKETLTQLLKETQQRYYKQPSVAFLQSMSFKAPLETSDLIISYYREYLHAFKQQIMNIANHPIITCTPDQLATSFITLFDGLVIQLVYENAESFHRSSQISFEIFWKGATYLE